MANFKKPNVKNPDLVEAINRFKEEKTPAAEAAMIEEIKNAKLIAPVIMQNLPEDLDLSDGKQVQAQAQFIMIVQKDGKKFFPAFTDWLEVLKWKNEPDRQTVVVTFEQYCGIVMRTEDAAGIVINAGEQGLVLTRERMAAIAGIPLQQPANIPLPETVVNPKVAFADASDITNQALLDAIDAFRAEQNKDNESVMIEEIHKARFIAPVRLNEDPENIQVEDGEKHQTQIQFVMVQNNDRKFFPVFTDMEQIKKWPDAPGYRTMILPFAQYAAMFVQNKDAEGLVINPFRENNGSIAMPKQQVIAMVQQRQQRNAVQLFDLKEIPMDLLKEMSAHMETLEDVHASYIMGMRIGGRETFMFILDCDAMDEERQKTVFGSIAGVSRKYTNDIPCGILSTADGNAKKLIEGKTPFYQD